MTEKRNLHIKNLTKSFDNGFEIKITDLQFFESQTIGILGCNGAGKSTLFQLISGNSDPTTGTIKLGEQKISPENYKTKRVIGYLPQNANLPLWATPNDLVNYTVNLYELKKGTQTIQDSLKEWDCIDFQNKPICLCSHGMQKRVGLALAHIHNPNLLILDEPFSGLDLNHIETLKGKILQRQKSNKITILSTHIIPFVDQLCDKVFILSQGNMEEIKNWQEIDFKMREDLIKSKILNPMKN